MQTTLIIIKPDAVQRGLIGQITSRFERKGLRIVGGKWMRPSTDLARVHYAEHRDKPFYDSLVRFITSTPVMALAVRGPRAVEVCRRLIGATDSAEAAPGTIRGDWGLSKSLNLVHGSDSPESARRELGLWFHEDELFDYDHATQPWIERSA